MKSSDLEGVFVNVTPPMPSTLRTKSGISFFVALFVAVILTAAFAETSPPLFSVMEMDGGEVAAAANLIGQFGHASYATGSVCLKYEVVMSLRDPTCCSAPWSK